MPIWKGCWLKKLMMACGWLIKSSEGSLGSVFASMEDTSLTLDSSWGAEKCVWRTPIRLSICVERLPMSLDWVMEELFICSIFLRMVFVWLLVDALVDSSSLLLPSFFFFPCCLDCWDWLDWLLLVAKIPPFCCLIQKRRMLRLIFLLVVDVSPLDFEPNGALYRVLDECIDCLLQNGIYLS